MRRVFGFRANARSDQIGVWRVSKGVRDNPVKVLLEKVVFRETTQEKTAATSDCCQ